MTVVIARNKLEPCPVPVGDSDIVVDLLELCTHSTIRTDVSCIFRSVGYPKQEVQDFALLAFAVFVADRQELRRSAPDAWRRSFDVYLPVSNVDLWDSNKDLVEELLRFLTDDDWQLWFRPGHNVMVPTTPPLCRLDTIDAVSLFSGGLDSFVGAIDLLEAGNRLVLAGHWDSSHTKCVQSKVYRYLDGVYPARTKLLSIGMSPQKFTARQEHPLPNQKHFESTTRSRSMLFVALGLLIANALSQETALYVPENGFISLNVPWEANRYGSCTTRSTHPRFLHLLTRLLQNLGIPNPVTNPYQYQTKGEMLRNCLNQEALCNGELITLSCSHPEAARWHGLSNRNCGYCLACLTRRAALYAVGRDIVENQYVFDAAQDVSLVLHEGRGATVRSMLHGLASPRRLLTRLAASGSLESMYSDLNDIKRLFRAGVEEIRQLFAEKACQEILEFGDLRSRQ